jgi:uncharacterized protein YbcV (DUF1398 family)
MISTKVTYTVKPDFAGQNKANINAFLTDFKKMAHVNFLYNVYLQEDGATFVHVSMYENEDVQQEVLNVPSFLQFQSERDASGLIIAPTIEKLSLIGSSLGVVS